ncbi:glycosyltransferase family 2 protein [Hymenobacter lapidiphilus]|uniref:Glycosyltransferase family 2 protein n=1 Tax=Hymenobacter lapidiphilus TaxID=2608003 RepID=A0A7Y7PQD1_9BACT|nr:glycosyltransferase family A protein [Hymenobacter lapidiphilus]NVO32126.1 glycosyltransferase family 2 protein [Hymenobacter lapidiphilus]
MSEYRVSYLVTTYNKLPYLRQVLGRLVAARLADEEIVVADGGSTDGTPEYLRELFEAGQIQQFVSERDKGESHGFNKCMLMAKGEMLKYVTDDDAFNYPTIRACVDFMQEHPEIDAVMGYNATTQEEDLTYARVKEDPAVDFMRWYEHKEPFWMIGLPLLIRRSSLPLLGLFYTGVVFVDLEYTYRISTVKANIAWCTALLSMHVDNPNGNFNRMSPKARETEYTRVRDYFVQSKRRGPVQVLLDAMEATKRPLRPVKRAFFDRMGWAQFQNPEVFATGYEPRLGEDHLAAVFRVCDDFMAAQNQLRKTEFIYKAQAVSKVMPQ